MARSISLCPKPPCPPHSLTALQARHGPLAALLFCHMPRVQHSIVNDRVVVRDGQLCTIDLPVQIERHNRLAAVLAA